MGCMELATNALFEKSAYEPGLDRNGPGRNQRDKERNKQAEWPQTCTFIPISVTKLLPI